VGGSEAGGYGDDTAGRGVPHGLDIDPPPLTSPYTDPYEGFGIIDPYRWHNRQIGAYLVIHIFILSMQYPLL
jgi:hypothetical protein